MSILNVLYVLILKIYVRIFEGIQEAFPIILCFYYLKRLFTTEFAHNAQYTWN